MKNRFRPFCDSQIAGKYCLAVAAVSSKADFYVRAGQRAAAIQALLGTAKLNGINPEAWLKETLEKLPTWPNSRIDELLPLAPEVITK